MAAAGASVARAGLAAKAGNAAQTAAAIKSFKTPKWKVGAGKDSVNLFPLVLTAIGMILLYGAVKGKDPIDVVKSVLKGKDPKEAKGIGGKDGDSSLPPATLFDTLPPGYTKDAPEGSPPKPKDGVTPSGSTCAWIWNTNAKSWSWFCRKTSDIGANDNRSQPGSSIGDKLGGASRYLPPNPVTGFPGIGFGIADLFG